MKMKKWLIAKLLKWSKILDIEKALRDKYHEGVQATEKKYEGKVNVWHDPMVRSYPQPQKIINPQGRYFKARHLEFMPEPVRTNTEPTETVTDPPFPEWEWLKAAGYSHISEVPTMQDLTPDKDVTEKVPAIVRLINQDREQRRHAG